VNSASALISAKAEIRQDEADNDNEADDINNGVHDVAFF
jgi:hypothetical protein